MAFSHRNVLLLLYQASGVWECLCLNFGLRTRQSTMLEALGHMLDALSIHRRWDGEVGRSFGDRTVKPLPLEATEFVNIVTSGVSVPLELTDHEGIEVKAAAQLLNTYAVWLVCEPLYSALPRSIQEGTPVSFENPGGNFR